VADPGFDCDSSASLRCRREKKVDGSGGQDEQALGRSRGGFGTKIHAVVNGLGLPVKLTLTPGQAADVTEAKSLLTDMQLEEVIGDKGYDSKQVVATVEAQGGKAVIPSRKNAVSPREIDWDRYKDRNLVERFWSKIKQYRRVATRFEKKAQNFLAFVHIASIMILLR
jgi:transposase